MSAKPNKILIVLWKEWLDIGQQRGLMLGIILPPLFLGVLPLVLFYITGVTTPSGMDEAVPEAMRTANPALAGMNLKELGQSMAGLQFSLLILLMPSILPSIIASYSVVGEKTERTLEPVLATPIKTWEFLLGKCLAAVAPSVILSWLVGLIFVIGAYFLAVSPRVFAAVVTPGWVTGFVLATPVLALISVAATVAISSRVNDPRSAQQISAFLIVPVMAIFFLQITGLIVLSPLVALVGVLILAAVAAGVVYVMVLLFQREVILTRWS